jgi:PKD repeat protein
MALALGHSPVASADDPEFETDLEHTFYSTQEDGSTSGSLTPSSGDATVQFEYGPTCEVGGQATCFGGVPCFDDGVEGVTYDVFLDGEKVSEVCVTEQQAAAAAPVVTPERVLRAFRSLSWPQSDLVIQPPDGQTLVNFPTNFYTEDDEPLQRQVTLLGRSVVIEATPAEYTWRFGDGETLSTQSPGAPYPTLGVTHEYATADAFGPSLDTTYTGRYRLEGGPWVAIPESLTVAGDPQQLTAIEARPTLVDY